MSDVERYDALARAFPESELGRRLLRRGTAFIGVIDLRRAFALHSRASLPALARLGLLRDLKRRYGQEQETERAPGLVFRNGVTGPAAASFPMGANGAFNMASSAQRADGSPPPAHVTRQQADPTTESATAKLRVKRPEASYDRREPYVPAAGVVAEPETQGRGTPLSTRRQEADARPSSGLLAPEPIDPIHRTEMAAAWTAAREASSDSLRAPPAERDMQSQGALRPKAPLLVLARREALAQQSTRADAQLDLMKTAASRASRPAPSAKDADPLSVSAARAQRTEPRSSERPNSIPGFAQDEEQATSLAPQQAVYAVPSKSGSTPGGPSGPSPTLVAEEIRASANASPAIVWRRAQHDGESRDVIPPSVADRPALVEGGQTLSRAGAQTDLGERTSPFAAPFTQVGAVDLANVARQVSRAIARQLRIDRERRGRAR